MVRIAADHPFFRDYTGVVLAPEVDLRKTSVNVDGARIRTEVIPDNTRSHTVSDAVRAPAAQSARQSTSPMPGQIAIGQVTMEELKAGIARTDSAERPANASAGTATLEELRAGAGRPDSAGRTVKLSVGFGFDARAVNRAADHPETMSRLIGTAIPHSQMLPITTAVPRALTPGSLLDLLA